MSLWNWVIHRPQATPIERDSVADADAKLEIMLDVQRQQLEETRDLRYDLKQIRDRLANDPMPLTGTWKGPQ